MSKNLFYLVMEAEGDELQAFDDSGGDMPSDDVSPPTNDDAGGMDAPPELNDDGGGMDDFSSMSDDGTDDGMGGDTGDNEEEADQKDTKLSDKANNILNEQLYKKMVARNSDVEETLSSIKDLIPLLPYDIVKSNDESIVKLKNALTKGQKYVINDFIDSGYGENLLFYQKLDSLYKLLMNDIDKNLKKIKDIK